MKTKAEPIVTHAKNSLKKQENTRGPHPLVLGDCGYPAEAQISDVSENKFMLF